MVTIFIARHIGRSVPADISRKIQREARREAKKRIKKRIFVKLNEVLLLPRGFEGNAPLLSGAHKHRDPRMRFHLSR